MNLAIAFVHRISDIFTHIKKKSIIIISILLRPDHFGFPKYSQCYQLFFGAGAAILISTKNIKSIYQLLSDLLHWSY